MSGGYNRGRFGRDFSLYSRLFIWNLLKLYSQSYVNQNIRVNISGGISLGFLITHFFSCTVFTVLQIMPNTFLLTVNRKESRILSETLFKTSNRKKGLKKTQLLWHKMLFLQWQ